MIEVFKTNVKFKKDALRIVTQLSTHLNECRINFDLSDCDKILRVETASGLISIPSIEKWLQNEGFFCEVLPD